MRSGADSEMVSILSREDVRVIGDAAGVPAERQRAGGVGASCSSSSTCRSAARTRRPTCRCAASGRTPSRCAPNVRIVEGRRFETGRNELIVGRGAAAQFAGLEVGRTLKFGQSEWTVVGIFDAGGTVLGLRAVVRRRRAAAGLPPRARRSRRSTRSSSPPRRSRRFKDALTTDPRLNLKVLRETDYYAEQSQMVVDAHHDARHGHRAA